MLWHILLVLSLFHALPSSHANVVKLTSHNFDSYSGRYEVVFMNFCADWCHFSRRLEPLFEEAAKKIALEFPDDSKVLFAKIDCDQENALCSRFHITKYPTLKTILNGKMQKREYRGQRETDAMVNYVKDLLKDPIQPITSIDSYHSSIDEHKPAIIAYVKTEVAPHARNEYGLLRKVAYDLKYDCHFYWVVGAPALSNLDGRDITIKYKPPRSNPSHDNLQFPSELRSYEELSTWAKDKCIPLVREITFENAEELTEEGLPFVILFHKPDDKASVELFTKVVNSELINESGNVNFLLADGIKFAHPLQHLGKSAKDLPLVAIDSFRHMYMFPHFEDINIPGKLRQFILDLYSGKLHREFHFGPEQPHDHNHDHANQIVTEHESTFQKLAPSRNRYTLLKDEL